MGPHFDAGFNATLMLVHIIVRARAYRGNQDIMRAKCTGSDVISVGPRSGAPCENQHQIWISWIQIPMLLKPASNRVPI